jgi:hypothetical protein|tara:strand:+ start:459 stop:767 length:309 start_codon:yes stop_codon:yes gene_type:complete
MIEELRQYLKNQKRKGESCEKILGTNGKVNKFALFWEKSQDDLMLVAALKQHEYVSTYEFTPEELSAYQKGLAEIAIFFETCWKEREAIAQKKLAENDDDVL